MKKLILVLIVALVGVDALAQVPTVMGLMDLSRAYSHYGWNILIEKYEFGSEKESADSNGKVFSYSGKKNQQIPGTDLYGYNKIQITSQDGQKVSIITFTTSSTEDYNALFNDFKNWGFVRGEEKTADGITGYYYSSNSIPNYMLLIQSANKYKEGNNFTVYSFSIMNIGKQLGDE